MTTEPITLRSQAAAPSAPLTTEGRATGVMLGGHLRALGQSVGWGPSFGGAILMLEAVHSTAPEIDGNLTQLLNAGVLDGLRGIAFGQFIRSAEPEAGKWSFLDVLQDRLGPLGVPIHAGLPIGHGLHPQTIPLAVTAVLDADAGTLTVPAGVR
jgi:muramoyltetrapeptide carboxypeptidase